MLNRLSRNAFGRQPRDGLPALMMADQKGKDMLYYSHMEEKYNLIEQILVWSKRKYTREQLEKQNLPKLREIYNHLEFEIISRI